MQLNYLGRYRSLRQFLNLLDTEAERKNNIILGRLTDNWVPSVPVFDPAKSFFDDASNVHDGVPAGNKCSAIAMTTYLVSNAAPATTVTGQTTVNYNGQTYYAIPVSKTNMQVLDTNGRPFLNLYLEFNFKVSAAGNEFTFRAIGFRDPLNDPTALCDANEVFAYEYVNPQTVNAGDGLTLRLILAF